MLQAIVGNASAEKVLLFMAAREIAQTFDTDVTPVKNQLERMERDGMLVFERVGRTKVYQFNPQFAFVNEVKALGKKALSFLPQDLQQELLLNRRRPRRSGKPL
jgi:hypothetical protein